MVMLNYPDHSKLNVKGFQYCHWKINLAIETGAYSCVELIKKRGMDDQVKYNRQYTCRE